MSGTGVEWIASKIAFDGSKLELVEDGQHPLHALYKTMANLLSVFVEEVAFLPFLSGIEKFFHEAEDRYAPAGMGSTPILTTIYNHWIFFDVRFKPSHETLGDCFLGGSDLLGLDFMEVEAVENLCLSQLGLYEILGSNGDRYWCELFFHGYLTRRFDAVFVAGFPDRPKTQPRNIRFNRGRRD